MTATRYRFGPFLLDPQARDLLQDGERVVLPVSHIDCLAYLIRHRDRPVGRDELAAAVWDRVDVSDVSVNHAIMRLRKLLGDTGSEQQAIRTVPRLGYRWIMPVVEEQGIADAPPGPPGSEDHGGAGVRPAPHEGATVQPAPGPAPDGGAGERSRWNLLAAVLAAAIMLALWWSTWPPKPPGHGDGTAPDELVLIEEDAAGAPVALVLPAAARVGGDWAWLRLGLMDLIGNRLRENGLTVTPSEAVVSLVAATRLPDRIDAWPDPSLTTRGSLMIRPEARRTDDVWLVRLHYREAGAAQLVEATDADVLVAARRATDSLAMRRGLVPVAAREGPADQVAGQVSQRIHAAVLAGQLDIARRLIADAPPEMRSNPEIVLSQSAIDFFSGDYSASAAAVEDLLAHWSGTDQPRLKARVLYQQGTTYVRLRRLEEADRAFVGAAELVSALNDPQILASVYTGRGVVAGLQLRLDDATRLLGQARVLHQMSNDAFGVVRVDLNLAAIALDRGQPGTALSILDPAVRQLELMAIPEARIYALRGMVDAQLMLLRAADALATSERFWPPERHSGNAREKWWLSLSRAVALTATGRLTEASALVDELMRDSDPDEDRFVRTEAHALLASIALLRGDNAGAAQQATQALTPVLEGANRLSHATTWLTRIRGLQRDGRIDEAAEDVRRMRAWADRQPHDWRMLFVVLAEAEQAHAEGRLAEALAGYQQAMEMAESVGIPENEVVVGEFWVDALIQAAQLDQASAVSGRLSQWADRDWRAAWAQARVYQAMSRADQAQQSADRARELAGERILPGPLVPRS